MNSRVSTGSADFAGRPNDFQAGPNGSPTLVNSPSMKDVFERGRRVAKFPSTILIEGETGVGKEVVANWIHQNSPRSNMPFTKVNCASIPESLLESELFGYERGAFTGAKREGHPGLFEQSDKGTLLLDEIGELPRSMQAKLLRVLQEREVRRVGGSWSKVIDVRVIACTNQDLRRLAMAGDFREDLYYRLNVVHLHVPALRERKMDIAPLVNYFLEQVNEEFGVNRRFSDDALLHLVSYDYPGNVRELRNLIEGLVVSSEQDLIASDVLPIYIRQRPPTAEKQSRAASLKSQLDETEQRAIANALQASESIRHAAKSLGISHSTLLRKMQRHKIELNSPHV